MKNVIFALLLITIVGLGGWLLLRSDGAVEVEGVVTDVNLDQIALDGPAIVTIETANSSEERIHVPSFGIMLCAANEDIADVYALQAGDVVAVRGERSEDGAIVPCADESHYLRVEQVETTE